MEIEISMSQGFILHAHTQTHIWKERQYFTMAYVRVPYANAKLKIKKCCYTKATCS